MKFMVLQLCFTYLTLTSSAPSLPVHPGVGGLYKGPNSETIIKGPDGSVITSAAEGGEVHTKSTLQPIIVAEPAPLVPIVAEPLPVLPIVDTPTIEVVAQPAVIEVANTDVHIIETELVDAPEVEPDQASDLVGPSGSISTRGSTSVVSGPASTTISEPVKTLKVTPIVTPGIPLVASVSTPILTADVALPISSVTVSPQLALPSPIPAILNTASPILSGSGQVATLSQSIPVIEATSSNGVLPSAKAQLGISSTVGPIISSTLRPEVDLIQTGVLAPTILTPSSTPLVSSTLTPPSPVLSHINSVGLNLGQIASTGTILNQDELLTNKQLTLNPLEIPVQNIIPPEIAVKSVTVSPGVLDGRLGAPTAPGIISSTTPSSNIQRIHSTPIPVNLGRISQQDQILLGGYNKDLASQISQQNQILLSDNRRLEQIPHQNPVLVSSNVDLGSQVKLQQIPQQNPVLVSGNIDLGRQVTFQQIPQQNPTLISSNIDFERQLRLQQIPQQNPTVISSNIDLERQLRLQQIPQPNELLLSNPNGRQLNLGSGILAEQGAIANGVPLLTNTNPILPHQGQIDNPNIIRGNLANSPVNLGVSRDVSDQVWNRYGRGLGVPLGKQT